MKTHPSRMRSRLASAAAATTAAALMFTGCAASAQSESSGGADELTVAITAYPSSWDQDFVAFDLIALMLHKNVYPFMVDYDVAEVEGGRILDTENIIPTWAESFESEDGQNWELKIREDAVFPSGNPITAEDVKWSKDRAFAAQANVAGVYSMIGLTSPDQITVVDERTVRFAQEWPSALSPQIQALALFVYDSKMLQEHATEDDPWAQDWVAQNPADGGYFVVNDFTPGQEIVLEANPDYPADNGAQIDTIRFKVVSDTASAAVQLREGDVDVAMGLSSPEIDDLADVEGVQILSAPNNDLLQVTINTESAPFDDPQVRQALAYAMPYDQIIESVYGGEARRPESLVPIDMPGYDDSRYEYDQDLDRAADLLESAGVEDLQLDFVYQAESAEQERIAILVQDALSEIGVTADPTPLDPATLGERRAAGDIPIQITSGQNWVNDVEYLVNNQYKTGAFLNYSRYSNPVVDANVEAARTVTDPTERNELWSEIQEQFANDVPAIPLVQPDFRLPVADHVGGFVQPVDGLLRFNFFTAD
ncbi:ABC transporter substrate-binding protein [Leucobacter sp. CSA1]|uniref:ABC transporter substrate-binding protein n=1 Tax=Leucobacter chromiisoli TaxID=2796471 RepID=A0A934UT93_9MICO|nr:ABC transporter substrate-binding protein [Leucobacter chromiisoli]MBK0417485.1 ABC transporter substrate-binding protein [Leucobacter chromiisoli]